ncbi:MAG: DUF5788 family protein [Methanosarcinaceae archaeon]|nr:DUF5788 family protein [Methanosarcinaceae archaeon]
MEDKELINDQERKKLLWSLRSDFAWAGKKVPVSVELDGREYRLQEMLKALVEKKVLEPEEATEIRYLIPKLRAGAKANEELLEAEELTGAEAGELFEEAVGLLRAAMEFKDILEKGPGKKEEDLKKLLETQKVVDEKRWQQFIKSMK